MVKETRFTNTCTYEPLFNMKPKHTNQEGLTNVSNALRPLIKHIRIQQNYYDEPIHRQLIEDNETVILIFKRTDGTLTMT